MGNTREGSNWMHEIISLDSTLADMLVYVQEYMCTYRASYRHKTIALAPHWLKVQGTKVVPYIPIEDIDQCA